MSFHFPKTYTHAENPLIPPESQIIGDGFLAFVTIKVGCVFPMVVVPILPDVEFGPNDYRDDAPRCMIRMKTMTIIDYSNNQNRDTNRLVSY